MYCPVCGAEYRPGFTECSDCQVALVPEPPRASAEETSAEYSSYVTIWSGDDPLKHAEILETLNDAGIPARSLNREDRSFHLVTMPAFEVFVPEELADSAQEALKQIVAVENPDDPGSGIFEIPAEEDVPDEDDYGQHSSSARAASAQYDEHEDANVQVWSGQDAATANMIGLSLRENEIPFRRDPDVLAAPLEAPSKLGTSRGKRALEEGQRGDDYSSGAGTAEAAARREPLDSRSPAGEASANTIFVYPEDERRAREIIREILSGSPPE